MEASAAAGTVAAQTLCWRSPQQLDRLRAGLQALLDDWARQWGTGAATVRLDNAWHARAPAEAAWRPIAAGLSGAVLAWLAHDTGAERALERLLFGAPAAAGVGDSSAAGLSAAVAGDALAALRRTLAHWLGAAEALADASEAPPAQDWRAWSGAVGAELAVGPAQDRLVFWLHVRAEAWPRPAPRAPATKSTSPAIARLPDALADHPLKLQARLADVQVTLGELMGLREGDVLVTSHRLADPLAVVASRKDAPTLYGGRLVQRQGRMAVALVQAA